MPRAPAGRGLARAWRVANLAAGQEKPPPIRAGGCEHAGEGLVWLLGGPYDGHGGGCEHAVGSYDGHGGGVGSCCLIAVDVGAEGRGPFRGAFFWYNAVSHHLLPAGFLTPPRVNGNSAKVLIQLSFFHSLLPFFGLFSARSGFWSPLFRFWPFYVLLVCFAFLPILSTARLLYSREKSKTLTFGDTKMHIIGVNDKNDNWLGIIIQNKTPTIGYFRFNKLEQNRG